MIGAAVGIPAASLCINRRLYHIASVQAVTITRAEKRRAVTVDLAIGLGIPLLEMILHVIVQGHRFNLFEEIGPYPDTFNTPPAYVLVFAWPLAIGLVSAVYCVLTIRAFARRRSQFKQLLSANKNLNSSRYFRLMALAGVELLFTIPLASYSIYLNVAGGAVEPYISWANAHWGFSRVDQVPAELWKLSSVTVVSLELTRWATVFCALLFFCFFGFADEARKHYKLAYNTVAKRVGLSTVGSTTAFNSGAGSQSKMGQNGSKAGITSIPVFVKTTSQQKRDSKDSFGGNLTDFTMSLNDYGAFDDMKEKEDKAAYSPTESSSASSSSLNDLPRIAHHDHEEVHGEKPTGPLAV